MTTSNNPIRDEIERSTARSRRLRQRDLALGITTPIVLLILWQAASSTNLIDAKIFTPPSKIFATALTLIHNGILTHDLLITSLRLLIGFILGGAVGVGVGILLGIFRTLRAAFSPLFAALYAVPQIAVLPLLLVIFGIGETPKILTVAAVSFFVLEINAMAGVRSIDPQLLEAGSAYGAKGRRLFWHVLLPGSLPAIFTGLRVGVALALVVVTATEFVAANSGLGYLVWNSWQLFEPNAMYVGLITIALVGVILTGIVELISRRLMPWRGRNTRD
ncbi:MAG: ABC transporter permease [Ferrimicrobium sp.]|jgi:NitT/TauT family transport system permease protein|uniref:ABC transporter permease n=1 Tax=Ferrimicrobium acidiphilum TaxID=121039 RepID=A0ABV3XZZ7_9ACTN|nr:ABC transporter permease [Ferrimicrobium sp.]